MSEPFLGELKVLSFNFAPKGWALCNGQLLPINQNQPLFSLLGTNYGGDGRTTFGLPDLRDRVPMHQGIGHTVGQRGGEAAHTLSISEIPAHNHLFNALTDKATTNVPDSNSMLGQSTGAPVYGAVASIQAMAPNSLSNVGGSQAHNNTQPFLTLNVAIALQGIFPSQN